MKTNQTFKSQILLQTKQSMHRRYEKRV